MAKPIWTEPALTDLRNILTFVRKDSAGYAHKLAGRILEASERLEQQPQFGGIVPEFEMEELRELFVRPYRVIYQVRDEQCYIVAVVHASRDLPGMFRPPPPK